LRLDDNKIEALDCELFAGLVSLKSLYVENNEMRSLPARTFAGLTGLEQLWIDKRLASDEKLFSGLNSLKEINDFAR
jgi:Leucine-rich repeat (LRR) protein